MSEWVLAIKEALVLLNKLVPTHAETLDKEIQDYETQWRAEYSKKENRDDNLLDQLDVRVLNIRRLYSDAIGAASSKN